MLDAIPLAGARRQVADADRQTGLIGEALQFAFPQPDPRTVAAATICRHHQAGGVGVACLAQLVPPAPDALDGECGSIGINADTDPSIIGGDIIDAIGRD